MPTVTPPGAAERLIRGAGYLAVAGVGAWIIMFPPTAIGSALGLALSMVWAAFILTAVPAAGAALMGWYRGEYAALPWFTGGLLVAVLHVWTVIGARRDLVPTALLMTALLLSYAVRFVTLHRLVRIRKGDGWTRTK